MRLRVVCFTLVILFIITVSSRPPAATSRSDVCLVQTLPPFSTSLLFLISPERQSVRAALEVRKDVDIISLLAWNLPSVGSEFGQINAVAGEIMQPEQCCQAAELAVYSGCLRACGQEVYVREGEASTWDKGRKTPGRKKTTTPDVCRLLPSHFINKSINQSGIKKKSESVFFFCLGCFYCSCDRKESPCWQRAEITTVLFMVDNPLSDCCRLSYSLKVQQDSSLPSFPFQTVEKKKEGKKSKTKIVESSFFVTHQELNSHWSFPTGPTSTYHVSTWLESEMKRAGVLRAGPHPQN